MPSKSISTLGYFAFACTIFGYSQTVHAQSTALSDVDAARLFGSRPDVLRMSLSPDGSKVVILTSGKGPETYINWAKTDGSSFERVFATNGYPQQTRWCDFVSNDRLVCQIYQIDNYSTGDIASTRLVAIDLNGENKKLVGQSQSTSDAYVRQHSGHIVNWLPNSEDKVLLAQEFVPERKKTTRILRKGEGLGLLEFDTRTGKSKRIEKPNPSTVQYYTDNDGQIRMKAVSVGTSQSGYVSGQYNFLYRPLDQNNWTEFGTFREDSNFWPYSVDKKSNSVFGLEKKDGREALYSISLDGNKTKKLIYSHPEVDVSGLIRFGNSGRMVGVHYIADKRELVYFDQPLAKLAKQLAKALPNLPVVEFIDASNDENILLIFAASDDDPGRYYIFDRTTKRLNEIALKRSPLEKVPLANVRSLTYQASDGTNIPAYLTLPPGLTLEKAKNIPALLLPHGGPASRDVWGFDWLVQFFANRGYAVLQPNFRGSTGYGEEWIANNGFRSWKLAIGDINDGGKWLVKQGIADPSKLAIVGWSYGGYAALQSGVVEPGLFKSIAAIAPVTDLKTLVSDNRRFTNYKLVEEQIGTGPNVALGSPLQNAEKLTVPVMLFHGTKDLNVSVRHSRLMRSKLENLGKTVKYHEYKDLDHQLPSSSVRAHMLFQINSFLKQGLN